VGDVGLLDEMGFNATAATTVQLLDGWVLRAAPEYPFRRCNSVFPNRGDGPPHGTALALVEDFYESRGLVPRFHLSPAAQPADLDATLDRAGYEVEAPVDVLVAEVAEVLDAGRRLPRAGGAAVHVADGIDDAWSHAYGALHGDESVTRARVEAYGRLMRTLGPPVVVATADLDGEPAGVGFGVVERGWLGVFGMGTRPDARRRGIATALLGALASSAAGHGATRCYLQVEVDNDAAQSLYRRAGYRRAYGYHYRAAVRR
jgi:ribosomal protein S18 acetylase RimI-like enzyme